MTPARKEEIRAMLAKRDQIAIVGGPGWQDQESLDVIRELLAALEEAERAQQPTGPCEHERTTPRFGRPSVCSDCGEEL